MASRCFGFLARSVKHAFATCAVSGISVAVASRDAVLELEAELRVLETKVGRLESRGREALRPP